jgi:hypothetical protein
MPFPAKIRPISNANSSRLEEGSSQSRQKAKRGYSDQQP